MEFVSQHYQAGDTVVAVATPPGEGGVAIVRVSGDEALGVANKVWSGDILSYATHTAHFGHVIDLDGRHVDDALALVMLGERSYTGEDTVEIQCHGGSLVTRRVLDTLLSAGARAAFAGEFTFKAFINGKLDLAQAEAVQELIAAKNERALDAADKQLQGELSRRVRGFQRGLTDIAAILEAWVDFPEEGLEFASIEDVCAQLNDSAAQMRALLDTYHDGRIVHDGLSLCLVGSPNVGKSSLMNALLDKDRAIVSHIAGTTRDIVEDHLRLNGLNVKITDTAGIRESSEIIEQEGIRRSKKALLEADLVLLVLDVTQPLGADQRELIGLMPHDKVIVVWNKCDLKHEDPPDLPFAHIAEVSATERTGLDTLRNHVDAVVWEHGPPSREEVLVTNVRHNEALSEAYSACRRVSEGLTDGTSAEFVSADMRHCLNELGRVIGTNVTEDILSAVFSKFCVGK